MSESMKQAFGLVRRP